MGEEKKEPTTEEEAFQEIVKLTKAKDAKIEGLEKELEEVKERLDKIAERKKEETAKREERYVCRGCGKKLTETEFQAETCSSCGSAEADRI